MPFVNIRLIEGHPQQRKDEIARRIVDAIHDVAQLPRESVWVTFEDVKATDWYVAEKSVAVLRQGKT